jgi:cell division control protein 24
MEVSSSMAARRVIAHPLLQSLVKASSRDDYPHYDELVEGVAACKRIADRINEAQRRTENRDALENLKRRVEDWKGHATSNFGELLLDDIFVVTKSDVDREYHVFLFEKIILCCKENVHPPMSAKKVGKSNSILKKQQPTVPVTGAALQNRKRNTPLLLKGRIFLTNVTSAAPQQRSAYHASAA